jgi:O-antigen ligase
MAIYVAAIGFVEFKTGQDLMPANTGVFLVEETGLNRVNGPFATNNSFGLVGLITLLLLVFLHRCIAKQMSGWQRLLHGVGFVAALATAVMPLFRSILVTLVLIVMLEFYKTKKAAIRVTVIAALILGAASLLWFKNFAPDMFEYRVSDPSDVYARIAQQKQTLEMFSANPINGVGWGNYIDAAYNFSDVSFRGVYSVGSAHNTLGAILAETGTLGFVSCIAAQFFLLRSFWRLRRRGTQDALLASDFGIYAFLAYWITGVSLSSGYYSDINMWYLFVIAVLYRFALTEIAREQPTTSALPQNCVIPHTSRAVLPARI